MENTAVPITEVGRSASGIRGTVPGDHFLDRLPLLSGKAVRDNGPPCAANQSAGRPDCPPSADSRQTIAPSLPCKAVPSRAALADATRTPENRVCRRSLLAGWREKPPIAAFYRDRIGETRKGRRARGGPIHNAGPSLARPGIVLDRRNRARGSRGG